MEHGPESAIDFGKLNAAERTALGLLAQGHTAKSIATLTDRSVGAVNERLREARRKTGIGSSRELARLFAAQENRDELIGVAAASVAESALSVPAKAGRSWKGTALMSVVLTGVIAAATFVAQPAPQTAPVPTSAVTSPAAETALMSDARSAKELHERIIGEPRDAGWALQSEAALSQWFAQRPEFAGILGPVTVRCGKTMCEAFGRYVAGASDRRINAAMQAMQGKPLHDRLQQLGMIWTMGSFEQGSFAVFAARAPN